MKVTHRVDEDGRVFCAAQKKSVDVLGCYGCARLLDIDIDSRQPRVTCELDDAEARPPAREG